MEKNTQRKGEEDTRGEDINKHINLKGRPPGQGAKKHFLMPHTNLGIGFSSAAKKKEQASENK